MGFCLFSNAAIAALHAQTAHGLGRVAVVDFDVHHGNGTQAIAMTNGAVFFGSIHEGDIYPFSGKRSDRGPAGNIINTPTRAGADGPAWLDAFSSVIEALDAFEPECVVISAGFDGHRADPLANLNLTAADYAEATRAIINVARRHCRGRVVSLLEGGYDLEALADCVAAHVRVLMDG